MAQEVTVQRRAITCSKINIAQQDKWSFLLFPTEPVFRVNHNIELLTDFTHHLSLFFVFAIPNIPLLFGMIYESILEQIERAKNGGDEDAERAEGGSGDGCRRPERTLMVSRERVGLEGSGGGGGMEGKILNWSHQTRRLLPRDIMMCIVIDDFLSYGRYIITSHVKHYSRNRCPTITITNEGHSRHQVAGPRKKRIHLCHDYVLCLFLLLPLVFYFIILRLTSDL